MCIIGGFVYSMAYGTSEQRIFTSFGDKDLKVHQTCYKNIAILKIPKCDNIIISRYCCKDRRVGWEKRTFKRRHFQ